MELILLVGVLVLLVAPFHIAIQYQLTRAMEADFLRKQGLAFPSVAAFDEVGPVIGSYNGGSIHASVTFMGLAYQFDRVAPAKYKHLVKDNEVYVQPGVVYVAKL